MKNKKKFHKKEENFKINLFKIINRSSKKADYRWVDSGMFIFCFVLIALIVWGMTVKFYYVSVDFRIEEAKVLSDKLLMAVLENGKLNREVFNDSFNILKEARIDSSIIRNDFYYFRVEILNNGEVIKKFEDGNREYDFLCEVRSSAPPACYFQDLIIYEEDGEFEIKILGASNNHGREI